MNQANRSFERIFSWPDGNCVLKGANNLKVSKQLTFTDAGFLAEVVALWALALEASESVDAVSTLAEAW